MKEVKEEEVKEEEEEEETSVGDDDIDSDDDDDDDDDDDEEEEEEEEDSDDEFEKQSSSDGDESEGADGEDDDLSSGPEDSPQLKQLMKKSEAAAREWGVGNERAVQIARARAQGELDAPNMLHIDDLSSDDEEDVTANTVGRVPLHWYDAYDHVGYDVTGTKVAKRKGLNSIDAALFNQENKDVASRTIYDMYNNRQIVLSKRDIEIIRRIQAGAIAHPEHNDTPDYVDYFTHEKEAMPLSSAPEPKSRLLPSKWEMMRVVKIAAAMKEGRYKTLRERQEEKREKPRVSMIWDDNEDEVFAESKRDKYHLPAPKMLLPGHAESYNPPVEYLLTEEEKEQYAAMDPSDRPYNFEPQKFSCLRHVPGYANFIQERFERCLDLYLCPRKLKKRLNINPETLLPKLPKPSELRPFPNSLCLQYLGHKKKVNAVVVSPDGQFIATGSDDCTIRLWEVDNCLCRYIWTMDGPVVSLAWNPNPSTNVIAAVVGKTVVFVCSGTGDRDGAELTEEFLAAISDLSRSKKTKVSQMKTNEEEEEEEGEESGAKKNKNINSDNVLAWSLCKRAAAEPDVRFGSTVGPRVALTYAADVTFISWHHKGDYLVLLAPAANNFMVSIHQVSKGLTQFPFSKAPGKVQAVQFHPSRPFLFVATQQHVKIYHLVEQKLLKKLLSGCKWLSSIDIHPSGDHVVLGSYDRRVVWFDLDLSATPYKTLKFHEKAIRGVQFHKRHPLLASASDDGSVHVFHATVYSDLSRSPLIVPVKVLRGHGVVGDLGVMSVAFHPRQPWVFSAGADGVVNLYQDI